MARCEALLAELAPPGSEKGELHMAGKGLAHLRGFKRFKALEALWINDNKLREIEGLHTNLQLKYLYVHNNNLGTLRGSLKNLSYLRTLCAYNNNLWDLQATLPFLSHLVHLENLDLFGNPLANETNYRLQVINAIPSLQVLDRHGVTAEERSTVDAMFGKAKKEIMAFGKRVPDFEPVPKQALASLSVTTSEMYVKLAKMNRSAERQAAAAEAALYETGELPKPPRQLNDPELVASKCRQKPVGRDYFFCRTFKVPVKDAVAAVSSSNKHDDDSSSRSFTDGKPKPIVLDQYNYSLYEATKKAPKGAKLEPKYMDVS